jgi:hypothetical protein
VEQGSPVKNPLYQKPLSPNEVRILDFSEDLLRDRHVGVDCLLYLWDISGKSDEVVPQ